MFIHAARSVGFYVWFPQKDSLNTNIYLYEFKYLSKLNINCAIYMNSIIYHKLRVTPEKSEAVSGSSGALSSFFIPL